MDYMRFEPVHIRADALRVGDIIVRANGSRYRIDHLYRIDYRDGTRCIDLTNLSTGKAEPPAYYNLSSVVGIVDRSYPR